MKTILFLFLIIYSLSGICQMKNDLFLLKTKFDKSFDNYNKDNKFQHDRNSRNEIDFMLLKSFHFYKNFISSQDISSCNYTPSCSGYAFQAIKVQGIFIGAINFYDRFTRCNGLNTENYKFLRDKQLLYDPVRNIKGVIIYEE
jgi:uncharacterized protein